MTDSTGRVTLGSLAEGISSFGANKNIDGNILLKPSVEISLEESWLAKNMQVLAQFRQGLADARWARVVSRGSFTQFLKTKAHHSLAAIFDTRKMED